MKNKQKSSEIFLRDVEESDLLTFFDHQIDPDSSFMAAFTSKDGSDKEAYFKKWKKILSDKSIIAKTIVVDGNVAGHLARFELFGKPEVTYWIGKEYWGKGLTTRSLETFLKDIEERPLYARAAKDNIGSIRVLEKCGFTIAGFERSFSNARGEEIEEVLFELM